ncbi:MAG: alpha/beta fold hydrolase [Acidimicrobiales bacterium]
MEGSATVRNGPRVRGAGGVGIATYHLGGDGPPVVLLHATGLHGRCWEPLAGSLADRFSVWAIDQRGHGDSGKAPGGRYDDWSVFVDDLFAVLDTIGGGTWAGLGHSMGATVLIMAEQRQPGTFSSLCCYEPVVVPPGGPARPWPPGYNGPMSISELTRKRRASFASRQEALERYAAKEPFSRFDPTALAAYVEFGFVDRPGGGVTLACRRDDEASVYLGAPRAGAWDRLQEVRVPVAVLGGASSVDPVSSLLEDVARRLPRGGARRFDGLGHFGPLEDPPAVGQAAAEALGAWGAHAGSASSA